MFHAAIPQRRADVIHQHGPNPVRPPRLIEQVPPQGGSHHLRQMLMLGDGGDLLLGQAAKGYAIVQ